MNNTKILVIRSCGQIGVELLVALRKRNGHDNVIAADIHYNENISPEIAP